MKYCTNCGKPIKEGAKFCPNCGEKISTKKTAIEQKTQKSKSSTILADIETINHKLTLKNNQSSIVKRAWFTAGFFLLIDLIALMEIIDIHPAIFFLSGFFFVSFVIIGFMLRSREKKLQSLISGEKLIASWTLTASQKRAYTNFLFDNEKNKNMVILFSISFVAIIVFGLFIAFIDEGKLAMLMVLIGLIAFLTLFAFGAPIYYRFKNIRNDGEVLIGTKYAYINGYFHNWDFPLSGLSKIKIIKKPFYGINLVYYYTDRTLKHSEELFIPADENYHLETLVSTLKENN